MLADRAFYHHTPERYRYQPALDWNDDSTPLPDVWVRAHPYGNPYTKAGKDAHGEYFDRATNFHDGYLGSIPVSYYHNYGPDGEPLGEPEAIGRTVSRRYADDGRWDKVRFDDHLSPELKGRIVKALAEGRLRASPTVIPDFHRVDDQTGHIDDWLTGSIAVLDALGDRQPASPKAVGFAAMKALYKSAHIAFPRELEEKHMTLSKSRQSYAKRLLKALEKAMGLKADLPEPSDSPGSPSDSPSDSPEEKEAKALFEDSNPERSGSVPYGLGGDYWTTQFNGPQSERNRFEGGKNFMVKDVQGLADEREPIREHEAAEGRQNDIGDPDIKLDWSRPQSKAMRQMKAQVEHLQARADRAELDAWFGDMVRAGKAMPAERAEIVATALQAMADDRVSHPQMKAASGKPVSRLRAFQHTVEARHSRFGERELTAAQMKALGYEHAAGFDLNGKERPISPERKDELLAASPLGAKILADRKNGKT